MATSDILKKVGEDSDLQTLKTNADALATLANTDPSTLDAPGISSLFNTAVTDVNTQVNTRATNASTRAPKLTGLTELLVDAVGNTAATSSLQDLTNDLNISSPGGGLSDITNTSAGGLNVDSALSAADTALQQPSIDVTAATLPDVDEGASALGFTVQGGGTESVSGGLVNPFKVFGNKHIKDTFDKDGNPKQVVVNKGVPCVVPSFDARVEAPPPDIEIVPPPNTVPSSLPKLYK